MKRLYEDPEIEVVTFAVEDIITSGTGGGMGGDNEGEPGGMP